ncbi:hypothetical protein R55227_BLOPHJLP_01668 [Fructobacillus tropaeoli]|uniref:hypothetical protein n=1 Tax=Fructobacillus tropaeoli TaxID=709323 RepID=UPI002DA63053|nr:hypothetical protein R55227_BLOPHJLP_01668 [Fructobacillus tropaeoli]
MTKKFTEEEYQKIADCFDKVNKKYNMGVMNPNLLIQMQDELFGNFNFIEDWGEIMAISNPRTRKQAHDQFVEKEKKCYWRHKKTDKRGNRWYLSKQSGLVSLNAKKKSDAYPFTESKIRSWGYDLDMYEKEEAEQ